MADEIGRMKSGEMIRVCSDESNNYIIKVAGEKENSFNTREEAVQESKVLMLKSWLPDADEKHIRNMLNSCMEIDYNFMLEWCERQAENRPQCECGCWGYPLDTGTIWTWRGNKYRGCPECGEKIED